MNHFPTRKGVVDQLHWEIFFPHFFPNSVFEPYLSDQGLLNSELVGDFQAFDGIPQWLELLKRKDEDGIIDFLFLGHKCCFKKALFSWLPFQGRVPAAPKVDSRKRVSRKAAELSFFFVKITGICLTMPRPGVWDGIQPH